MEQDWKKATLKPAVAAKNSDATKDYFGLKCILSYVLLRPGSDNSISLWCLKMPHTIDISNNRSSFPFWDNCFVWL